MSPLCDYPWNPEETIRSSEAGLQVVMSFPIDIGAENTTLGPLQK